VTAVAFRCEVDELSHAVMMTPGSDTPPSCGNAAPHTTVQLRILVVDRLAAGSTA
jgi:hypothetical protein